MKRRAMQVMVALVALFVGSSTCVAASGAAQTDVIGPGPAFGGPGTVNHPAVGIASDPSGDGYWLTTSDGGVFTFGSARFAGAAAGTKLSTPIVDIASTPSGGGYWLVGSDGSLSRFGDAGDFGSFAGGPVPGRVVAMTASPDGGGYWFVTSDGGVFTFGTAKFFGSLPGINVRARAVDLITRPQNDGYWIVDDAGGVHPFGAAPGVGSLPTTGVAPAGPVVGGAVTTTGNGYWIASLNGGVYTFGDAAPLPVAPVAAGQHAVGIAAAASGNGYWVATSDGLIAALPGDAGDHVRAVQQRLSDLGYWMGAIDGKTGMLMSQAVMAFQKYTGLPRTGVADQQTVDALSAAPRPVARTTSGNIVEIDKPRQIIFVVQGGKTVAVFNSSTGSNVPFREKVAGGRIATGNAVTPDGRFSMIRELPNGWRTSDLGQLWRPKYFTSTGIAVHGASSVPAYPASHGCARVSVPAMNFIYDANLMPKGIAVWVY